MEDSLREECGVFGVFGDTEAANLVYLGLHGLQHRGQEGFGIATVDHDLEFHTHKAFGLVGESVNHQALKKLEGKIGIGHVRYSTHGGKHMIENVQPFTFKTWSGQYSICHNGNITNADQLRKSLESEGAIFQSSSDSEVFMHLLAHSKAEKLADRVIEVLAQVKGAYSLLIQSADTLIGVRDPFGFRPLALAKMRGAHVLASESCALDLIEAEFVRELKPGELLEITSKGLKTSQLPRSVPKPSYCSFEAIYFSRPDSRINDSDVYTVRKKIGAELSREVPVDADIVIAIPDSGVAMAMGYAEEAKIPHEIGLVRNHYIGRTFIEPSQSIRDFGVKLKLNPVRSVLEGKRVIVVDDSIVRGTTSVKIVRMLRRAGAKEIHLRVGSPPITHSCYFGVDTPNRSQLIAAQKSTKEIAELLGVNSLSFLSIDGLKRALGGEDRYCLGCFSGNYPEETFAD